MAYPVLFCAQSDLTRNQMNRPEMISVDKDDKDMNKTLVDETKKTVAQRFQTMELHCK